MTTADRQSAQAKAQCIHDTHGVQGTVVIAERIGAVTASKDQAQVNFWMAIAAAFIQLQGDTQAQWDAARHLRKLLEALI